MKGIIGQQGLWGLFLPTSFKECSEGACDSPRRDTAPRGVMETE